MCHNVGTFVPMWPVVDWCQAKRRGNVKWAWHPHGWGSGLGLPTGIKDNSELSWIPALLRLSCYQTTEHQRSGEGWVWPELREVNTGNISIMIASKASGWQDNTLWVCWSFVERVMGEWTKCSTLPLSLSGWPGSNPDHSWLSQCGNVCSNVTCCRLVSGLETGECQMGMTSSWLGLRPRPPNRNKRQLRVNFFQILRH